MSHSITERHPPRPLIFGEVLFDTFPDGSAVLGGAPFNVAWHLQGFGVRPLLVSRVGQDEHGQKVLKSMQAWNMDTAAMQVDHDHPTGGVVVGFDAGEPSFDIVAEQAYDYINTERALQALGDERFALLYCGTLIARHEVSAATLEQIQRRAGLPRFVDVNLRSPWWNLPLVQRTLSGSRWVKLNDTELFAIAGGGDLAETAQHLRAEYNLEMLIVTSGAEGAHFCTAEGLAHTPAAPMAEMVDTVGAGDAFSAVVILGLLHQWPPELTRQRALAFASAVCGIRGATTNDKNFYLKHLDQWQEIHSA